MQSAERRRALYISAFLPDADASHAGGQVAFQNVLGLRQRGFETVLMTCSTEPQALRPADGEIRIHQTRMALGTAWIRQLLEGPREEMRSWPVLNTRANALFESRLRAELSNAFDLVFVDFTQMLYPVWRVLRDWPARPRVVFCAHDVFSQKVGREALLVRTLWHSAVTRTERRLLNWVDEIVTLSEKDRRLIDGMCSGQKAVVKPFVPPAWVADVTRDPRTIVRGQLLFFANFDRGENREALEWLIKAAMPRVVAQAPHVRLVLAGGGSDVVPIPRSACKVIRLGYLKNPAAAFSTCQLLIAPLSRGAGVKFKVLEALASGVPVVGTPVAFEGISPSALTHEVGREGLCDALIGILKEPGVR